VARITAHEARSQRVRIPPDGCRGAGLTLCSSWSQSSHEGVASGPLTLEPATNDNQVCDGRSTAHSCS
jgi:hypothetical protein